LQRDLRAILTEKEYFGHSLGDTQSTEWVRLRMEATSLDLTDAEWAARNQTPRRMAWKADANREFQAKRS
jgi:hypothetical protein